MCQWFSSTSLVITCEGGNGIEDIVVQDESGRVTELKLSPQVVMMPNHQIYVDWLYIWTLAHSMRAHADVLIIFKDSLKWIPTVGWARLASFPVFDPPRLFYRSNLIHVRPAT